MEGNRYKELAMITNDGKASDRLLNEVTRSIKLGPQFSTNTGDLINGALGLTGEAGEVADLIKKGIFHEKGIDLFHLRKELGDVMWYIAMICNACNFDLDCIMEVNIDKLRKRYPEGFDIDKANNRKDEDI